MFVKERRNEFVGNCVVTVFPWIDREHIYVNVREIPHGGAISKPISDKSVYIELSPGGIDLVNNYIHTLVDYIKGLNIPEGGKAVIKADRERFWKDE